jgi:hypothetical protein
MNSIKDKTVNSNGLRTGPRLTLTDRWPMALSGPHPLRWPSLVRESGRASPVARRDMSTLALVTAHQCARRRGCHRGAGGLCAAAAVARAPGGHGEYVGQCFTGRDSQGEWGDGKVAEEGSCGDAPRWRKCASGQQ